MGKILAGVGIAILIPIMILGFLIMIGALASQSDDTPIMFFIGLFVVGIALGGIVGLASYISNKRTQKKDSLVQSTVYYGGIKIFTQPSGAMIYDHTNKYFGETQDEKPLFIYYWRNESGVHKYRIVARKSTHAETVFDVPINFHLVNPPRDDDYEEVRFPLTPLSL